MSSPTRQFQPAVFSTSSRGRSFSALQIIARCSSTARRQHDVNTTSIRRQHPTQPQVNGGKVRRIWLGFRQNKKSILCLTPGGDFGDCDRRIMMNRESTSAGRNLETKCLDKTSQVSHSRFNRLVHFSKRARKSIMKTALNKSGGFSADLADLLGFM